MLEDRRLVEIRDRTCGEPVGFTYTVLCEDVAAFWFIAVSECAGGCALFIHWQHQFRRCLGFPCGLHRQDETSARFISTSVIDSPDGSLAGSGTGFQYR